jgi:hypothetical protein
VARQRTGTRKGVRKQGQSQVQIQTTMRRREGVEELSTPHEEAFLPGAAARVGDLGPDEEADGDCCLDDGAAAPGEAAGEDFSGSDETDEEQQDRRRLALADLLGSRPPVVLLRLGLADGGVEVRTCARPASPKAREALEMLRQMVARCFADGRSHLAADEWDQLLGLVPAPLVRRLMLLLRLAIEAGEKVRLGEETRAAFTPHDVGLERFANKFAALPDGTPFGLRLLLLDRRGTEGSEHLFDRLPDAVKLLALRRALQREQQAGKAVDDYEFGGEIQKALAELLGMEVHEVDRPTEDQVRRRLRDNFKRRGLPNVFPNQAARQVSYDRAAAIPCTPTEKPA